MCTAATYETKHFYFGRNLDLEYSYEESVTVTPRNFPLVFRHAAPLQSHYAMIGMSYVKDGYPLYYEATNEKGLSMAGLNFVGNAVYQPPQPGKDNIASFEFIPWLLGQCDCLKDVRQLLARLNLTDTNFSPELPAAQLHWIIADREGAIVVESVEDGLHVYDDPAGVLTNNPPFPFHMQNLCNYMSLSPKPPANHFCQSLKLEPYSRGMGAMGLPGDCSSSSRFVKAAFTRLNSTSGDSELESVSQLFHILGSVAMPRGSVCMGGGKFETTIYTCCCNTDTGVYYYTTYDNGALTAVDMHREDLEGTAPRSYPMVQEPQVFFQN